MFRNVQNLAQIFLVINLCLPIISKSLQFAMLYSVNWLLKQFMLLKSTASLNLFLHYIYVILFLASFLSHLLLSFNCPPLYSYLDKYKYLDKEDCNMSSFCNSIWTVIKQITIAWHLFVLVWDYHFLKLFLNFIVRIKQQLTFHILPFLLGIFSFHQ